MAGPQNAQDFIRALKASSDPPHVGGPPKIDIAAEAWTNTALYVPNKAEAIVEWILTRLLKDRSKDRSSTPVRDSRYWALLARVLAFPGADKHGDGGRAVRIWLVPLLNRVPVAPIILSYLESVAAEGSLDSAQHSLFTQCIGVLWPLAVPKINPETLLECFGAALQLVVVLRDPDSSDGGLQALDDRRALSLIVSSYRTALTNSGSKRKQLCALFLQKHLYSWLQVATRSTEGGGVQLTLASDIYDAGIETIFGLDILKQAADQKHESALADSLERILATAPETVLRPLPRLFASYVQAVKRHKSALFGQGSSQAPGHVAEQLQAAAMAFYGTCDALARAGEEDAFWQCRVALLEVVERENLLNLKDENAKGLLRQDGDTAVGALTTPSDAQHPDRLDCAVKILAVLTRIDYDLMSARSAAIFPRLVAIPPAIASALQYLELLLEFDSKTRNLPATIAHLSGAFSVQHLQRIPDGPQGAYNAASAGPLTSLQFFDRLSSAVHSFLTPGQVLETIGDVTRILADAYELFLEHDTKISADRGDGPRKKRKKDASAPQDHTEPEYCATSFALIARTMVVILRSVPLHTLTEDVRAEAQRLISDIYSSVAIRALKDGLTVSGRAESRHWQTALIGALRLHYGLVRAPGLDSQPLLDQEILQAMLSLTSAAGSIPELTVETFRTLLHQCSLDTLPTADVLESLLAYLEAHLPSYKTAWTGKAHTLSSDAESALALLHLLADRWLPYFDAWSTPEHRKRFAQIVTNAKLEKAHSSSSGLTVPIVITRMLHDAQFWELINIRDSFLAQLNEQTASLDKLKLAELLTATSSTPKKARHDNSHFLAAYDILLLTPPEYLPRPMQVDFLRRGFVADALASEALRSPKSKGSKTSSRQLLVVREFLRRTIAYLGNVESVMTKEFLYHLTEHASAHDQAGGTSGDDLRAVTMELIDMYQGALVRSAKKGSSKVVADLVHRYAESYTSGGSFVCNRPSLLLIDCIAREGSVKDFPTEIIQALRELYAQMLSSSLKHLSPLVTGVSHAPLDLDVLDSWSHTQILRRWLKEEVEEDIPFLGQPLSRRLLSWGGDKKQAVDLAPVVLSILLGEVQAVPSAERAERLQYVVVVYLSLVRVCGRHDAAVLESRMRTACRTFSPEDFGVLLELLFEALPVGSGLSTEDTASLIRFSAVVLRDAPESTSKICQSFTTRSLNLFANDERFTYVSSLRGEVVDFIVRQCNERPASLRVADLSSLWSILRALLTGSPTHDETTDPAIFNGAVNILSALVRLRRDLVLNTLPHLGFALRQLISCLRSLRPQLGGKQRRLVLDTLPRWLAPAHALGAAESRALARLLTTLTTKTMVRTHGADTPKPEALARPFAKHAAYVLTAYVDAVGDPLCFVAAGVRRELQPGLYALCDMLGEHNRDAMMVSALDAGGKATMKALWKEYEKQRYVGKG
ncbi:Urb2/Npa2 family-domain-containing protein [Lenzites betulinus]|nr:Urb2/Npa2 family-domain-containing protein [Lenzites betulinus]